MAIGTKPIGALVTMNQAIELLALGRTTIYKLIKDGDLRPVYFGRSVRFSYAELERFVGALMTSAPR